MPRSPPPGMDLRLLGPIEAHVDGRPIALGAPKQRSVLAMLALQAGRTVSADRLAEGLWGEQPPASAPKMVQLYVSQLRRLFEGDGAHIVTRGRGYELQLVHGAVDAIEFERLLEQDRARDALALWRGEPLADVADEPFAAAEIRRLDELRVRAAEAAIDADLAAGRHDEVIGELEALIERASAARAAPRAADAGALSGRPPGRGAGRLPRGARRCWSSRSASSRAPSCVTSTRRSWPRTRRSSSPRRRRNAPPASPPPRRVAPVLAIAALLLFAGIVAFGISRVLQPDSLSGIREDHVGLIDADGGRITDQYRVGHGPQAVAAGAGSVWVANRLDGTVSRIDRDERDRDDRRRRRADGPGVRRRVAVGRGRPGPERSRQVDPQRTRSKTGSRSATPRTPSPSTPARCGWHPRSTPPS